MSGLLARLFPVEEINGGERCPTYMYRWHLASFRGWKVYLHKFVADDWSRDLHDHPKRFISIGLWGQYVEEARVPGSCPTCPGRERTYRAPWIRSFPAEHIHRIRLIDRKPCWTLVIVGRPVRPWGFWHDSEWIPWRKYVSDKGGPADRMKACE